MTILAIGERFNQPECTPEDKDSFKLRVEMGLYNHGSRRDFLNEMGVHWTHGINLLWPHPIPGEWDEDEAWRTAVALGDSVHRYDTVILFGRRVCDAFDVPYKVGCRFGRYLPLPHPMGNRQLWNKNFIKEMLS